MDNFKTFKTLHNQNSPLLLGNAWNVQSALLEKSRFKAIGTSSAAIANSLGYEDGEKMSFDELLRIVKSIQSKINIPLTVDIEGGYSRDTSALINNIIALHELGVVGINLEDSVPIAIGREILGAEHFSEILGEVKSHLSKRNINFFVNARTDAYIMGLNNPLDQTTERINLYEKAGADGIFVPCIVQENEIKKIVESTTLPINVMCMPDLPSFKSLEKLGGKRISMGPFLYNNTVSKLESSLNSIVKNQSFKSLFS